MAASKQFYSLYFAVPIRCQPAKIHLFYFFASIHCTNEIKAATSTRVAREEDSEGLVLENCPYPYRTFFGSKYLAQKIRNSFSDALHKLRGSSQNLEIFFIIGPILLKFSHNT